MKLKNKILTLIAGTLTTFALTSCNDFLDRDPLGQFTEDDAPNALIGGKMYNVYYLMRSYNITAGIPAFMIHMVRSEDSEKGSDAGDGADQAAMWDDFQYTASNGTLSAYWGQNYKIIYQCNEILDDLEKQRKQRRSGKCAYQRRSPVLPRLLLLQPCARLGRSASGDF